MEQFTSIDLQKRTGDVQHAASKAPIVITRHGKPRNVMMSVEEYDRLQERAASAQVEPPAIQFKPAGARLRGQHRTEAALRAAGRALAALELLDYRAWLVGSLANGRFQDHSDIDIVIDAEPSRHHLAFRIIEEALKGFEFDMVDFKRLPEDAVPFMMKGAKSASELRLSV